MGEWVGGGREEGMEGWNVLHQTAKKLLRMSRGFLLSLAPSGALG